MDVADIIASLKATCPSSAGLTADSRRVRPGDVFLAYPGKSHDGRHHIADAVAAGASAVVWEPDGYGWPDRFTLPNLALPGLKAAAAALAAAWYGEPSGQLWMVGITGTNGKTSVSHWLGQAFTAVGRPTAILGTLGNGMPDALDPASHTTPDAVSLQALLARYRDAGAWGVAMEVSSHGLDQGRVDEVRFDVGVLTNLSRDHLDYHGDMESYAQAKARLFGWTGLRWAVLNTDDEFGRALSGRLQGSDVQLLGYGLDAGADVRGEDLRLSANGLQMRITTPWGAAELASPLMGEFNAYNLLAALSALLASEMPFQDAMTQLSRVRAVAGRMQALGGGAGQPLVVVDYAHTPDALEKTLLALKPITPERLVCVFGAGGGRDRGKRALMGGVAASLADQAIVTSDNPRNEDPAEIIADILAGMPPGQTAIVERSEAIATAIREAGEGDIVLIAGKGHEDYQEVRGVRHPFSDVRAAETALGLMRH